MRQNYLDDQERNSPDELAEWSIEEIAPRRRSQGTANTAQRSPAVSRRTKSTEFELTPSKMIAEQNLSPWHIKVTVEAEPEDNNGMHTQGKTQTVTRTMKILLYDANSPSKKKVTRSKANLARTRSQSRRQSVTDLDIVVLGDDGEEDEWGVKPKSPRKKRTSRKSNTAISHSACDFEIQEDPSDTRSQQKRSVEDGSPELQEADLNEVAGRLRTNETNPDVLKKPNLRIVSYNSAASYPTPSPTASEHGRSDDKEQHEAQEEPQIGLDTVMEGEGFTMIDLDTIPSVQQLRNTPEYPALPQQREDESATTEDSLDETASHIVDENETPSIAITSEADSSLSSSELPSSPPSTKGTKKKAYSIAHLRLPSSTNVQRHRLVTPMPVDHNPYSSPKLPSPPCAPVSTAKERSPVHSDKAEQASEKLVEAVTPEKMQEQTVEEQEEALFGGFSSGTRRELRAELRFGEELGRRQIEKQRQQVEHVPKPAQPIQPQIWHDATTVQHTPPITHGGKNSSIKGLFAANEARLEKERQQERDVVVKQAQSKDAILIEDERIGDEDLDENDAGEADTTMGDIWLAEAKETSSSPGDSACQASASQEPPRRKLIPSPWKRGQQIETSHLSGDESFSGLFWRQPNTDESAARFGEAIVKDPERLTKPQPSTNRRRSGMYDAENMFVHTPRRISEREESDDDDQDLEDENFDEARAELQWRSAADVVDEETNELEAEHAVDDEKADEPCGHNVGTTRLYETNLEGVDEHDFSASPQLQRKQSRQEPLADHDSTYSSISSEITEKQEPYLQRTSLSPSKERPNTPKSALKGTRLSFGQALTFGHKTDDVNARRVVWARRASAMNDHWEESSHSIRSSQTVEPESSVLSKKQGLNLEASFEVQPQPPQQDQQGNKGWFGWFKAGSGEERRSEQNQTNHKDSEVAQQAAHTLDGSIDKFVRRDEDENSDSSFAPTSRHTSIEFDAKELRKQAPTESQARDAPRQINNNDGHLSCVSASSPSYSELSLPSATRVPIPSYLLPPSCPSDRSRDPSQPLSTSGRFTNSHFRTLHIIYKKSQKPRFHGPAYPTEIRPSILEIAGRENWKFEVDESATMGEDGLFEFVVGGMEARVLERFMKEVEKGYLDQGKEVKWGWTVKDLAERLGRIAIGESVREEEREAEKILMSARKTR